LNYSCKASKARTSYNTVFTLRAVRPLVTKKHFEVADQVTTLHWLSPSDPPLTRL